MLMLMLCDVYCATHRQCRKSCDETHRAKNITHQSTNLLLFTRIYGTLSLFFWTIYYGAIHIDRSNSVLYECLRLIFTLYSPGCLFLTHFPGVSILSVSMAAQFQLFCFAFHTSQCSRACTHTFHSFTHRARSLFDRHLNIIRKHVFIQMIVCPHVMCVLRYCGGSFCFSFAIFFAFNAIDFKLKLNYNVVQTTSVDLSMNATPAPAPTIQPKASTPKQYDLMHNWAENLSCVPIWNVCGFSSLESASIANCTIWQAGKQMNHNCFYVIFTHSHRRCTNGISHWWDRHNAVDLVMSLLLLLLFCSHKNNQLFCGVVGDQTQFEANVSIK